MTSSIRWGLCVATLIAGTVRAAATERTTVLVSDLHLGVGRDASQRWYELEDARWADDWRAFLSEIKSRGHGKTDLVLNGDTFELWQSVENDCPETLDLSCTESEAMHRLSRVLQQHAAELEALRDFATSDDNRVVIVPGNHDVALLYPAVASAVLRAIGAPPARVRLATKGYWLSDDGLVYAEHGHQIGKEVNKFDGWPHPFVDRNGTRHLQRPWGERFVQDFYNRYEWKYPIIDNISEEGVGIKYALAAEKLAGTAEGLGTFLHFFLLKLSWKQVGAVLAPAGEPSTWDVDKIKHRETADRFIVESLSKDDPIRAAAAEALAAGTLPVHVGDLTDEEIGSICDYRAALEASQKHEHRPLTIEACPAKHLGAVSQKLLRSRNAVFGDHLRQTWASLRQSKPGTYPFQTFVFSHTHVADAGFQPLSGSSSGWNPLVVNTGAWQRVITPGQLAALSEACKLEPEAVLPTLQPEDLPPCYSVILIAAYKDEPVAILRYWKANGDHTGALVEKCDVDFAKVAKCPIGAPPGRP